MLPGRLHPRRLRARPAGRPGREARRLPGADAPQSRGDAGALHSQRVLLALTEAGLPRQRAYELVQRNAMRAWTEERPLLELLEADPEATAVLPRDGLARLFDLDHHLRHVDVIFRRVFGRS